MRSSSNISSVCVRREYDGVGIGGEGRGQGRDFLSAGEKEKVWGCQQEKERLRTWLKIKKSERSKIG